MNPNDSLVWIRLRAAAFDTPLIPELTEEQEFIRKLIVIIDEGRAAMDPAKPSAQRTVLQRAWLDKTDPVSRPVVLGGEGL